MTVKSNITYYVLSIIFVVISVSCAGKRIDLDPKPGDMIFSEKTEFLKRYRFLVTPAEAEPFVTLSTETDFKVFVDNFWKIRDTNPLTPENEYKELIDSRIADIENEKYQTDFEIPGTRFVSLNSELAHVYLLHGEPSYKEKLNEGRSYVSMVVWYYFDVTGHPIMKFLFYEKYGRVLLFKNHAVLLDYNYLFDPQLSPLKDISISPVPDPENLYNVWTELDLNDPQWIFRGALFEFSYYNDFSVYDALRAPEPAAVTAVRLKPVVIGQPGDFSEKNYIFSRYNSFIPGTFRFLLKDKPRNAYALFKYGNLDWEIISDDTARCVMTLRISFQNKETKKIHEFLSDVHLLVNEKVLEMTRRTQPGLTATEFLKQNKDNIFPAVLGSVPNFSGSASEGNLSDFLNKLKPGEYVMNADLRHRETRKYSAGWREEITIK